MRKIAASYLFPVNAPPLKNGILTLDENNKVVAVTDTNGHLPEISGLEYYNGFLVPGFVNAHCHLELSHLRNQFEKHCGMGGFLGSVNKLRSADEDAVLQAASEAEREMFRNGIVAVGDISNNFATLRLKKNSPIVFHTFVETYGFDPSRAERAFFIAENIYEIALEMGLKVSVTPHSAYSVSEPLFQKIKIHAEKNNTLLSFHNQESQAENEFFKTGSGEIVSHLEKNLGIEVSGWQPTGKNSLESVLRFLPNENPLLLVHNTVSEKADVKTAQNYFGSNRLYFVLCPNSNLFITNRLPDIAMLAGENACICIGTDSLASNSRLSVLAEIQTIGQNFPEIGLPELVKWATLNGAKALGLESRFGSFEAGKQPGLNLITGVDVSNLKLTPQSKIKRLA